MGQLPNNQANDQQAAQSYRDAVASLGNPPLTEWGKLALSHWAKFRPDLVEYLKKLGVLKQAAIVAQEQAKDQYARMVEQGADPYAAREQSLEDFILLKSLDEEDHPDEIDRENGEQNQLEALDKLLASIPDKPPKLRLRC